MGKKTCIVYNVEEALEKQVFTLLARDTDQHKVMKGVYEYFPFFYFNSS